MAELTLDQATVILDATLAKGAAADVVLLDPDLEWVVDAAGFKSRGKNTPFHGQTVIGRVLMTICGGNVVFDLNQERIETAGALGS